MTTSQNKLYSILDAEHNSNLFQTLNLFIENESFLDITFVCEGGFKVKSHKLVVGAASPFLKSIIEESELRNPEAVILLPEVRHCTLKLLLNFLYEGRMRLDDQKEFDEFQALYKLLGFQIPETEIIFSNLSSCPPPLLQLDRATKLNIEHNRKMKNLKNSTKAHEKKEKSQVESLPVVVNQNICNDPLNVPDIYFVPAPQPADPVRQEATDRSPEVATNALTSPVSTNTSESSSKRHQDISRPNNSIQRTPPQSPLSKPVIKPPPPLCSIPPSSQQLHLKNPPPPALPLSAVKSKIPALLEAAKKAAIKRGGVSEVVEDGENNKRGRTS